VFELTMKYPRAVVSALLVIILALTVMIILEAPAEYAPAHRYLIKQYADGKPVETWNVYAVIMPYGDGIQVTPIGGPMKSFVLFGKFTIKEIGDFEFPISEKL